MSGENDTFISWSFTTPTKLTAQCLAFTRVRHRVLGMAPLNRPPRATRHHDSSSAKPDIMYLTSRGNDGALKC